MLERLCIAGVTLAIAALSLTLRPSAYAQTPPVTAAAQAQPMITAAINDAVRATLAGNTRPEATAANDLGPVDDAMPLQHMQLQLRRPAAREEAVKTLIEQLHDPKSPNFHHWLTAAEFGAQFSPAASDIAAITGWLRQQGFTVNFVYPSGMSIDYSGTAGQVRTAFHTELHHLSVNGVAHFANMSDPEIPAALAPAVVGIVALHDFKPRSQFRQGAPRSNFTGGGGQFYVVPADLATIYNFNPLYAAGYSGQGQTIYLVEPTDLFSADDWTTFRTRFSLTNFTDGSLTTIHPAPPSGPTNCAEPGVVPLDESEAILDAEWASAAAPSAAIVMATCKDTATIDAELTALQNLINGPNPPAIISNSYGECEAFNGAANTTAYAAIHQQGVAEGTSIFVAAGDETANSCDGGHSEPVAVHGIGVDAQASTPYNVAVGGTDYADTYLGTNSTYWSSTNGPTHGSALSYIPEIPWNETCASQLLALFNGFSATYGASSFCNSQQGQRFDRLSNTGGSGGPSGCATGTPSVSGVVSGTCAGWPKPTWQNGFFGNPADGVRDIPDVALFAANGAWNHDYVYCWSDVTHGGADCSGALDNWSLGGGTSFASPIYAGIQALVNQYSGSAQGLPNYVYYRIATAEYGASGNAACNSDRAGGPDGSCIFYDVTLGDNNAPCLADGATLYNCYRPAGAYGILSTDNNNAAPAYLTTIGWDFPTGIGTVNVYNLVTNWASAGGGAGLTVTVSGSGTVTSNPAGIDCPSTCSFTFAGGPLVTLTATPLGGSNWVFSGWSGACSGAGPCTVTMNTAQSVTATFVQGFTLSLNVSGSGTVASSPAGENCPSTCSDGYASGTPVTLTATPASGWSFSGWSSGIATSGLGTPCSDAGAGPCTVIMNTATSVTVIFTKITYPLAVSVFGNGTVTSSPVGINCGATCSSSFGSGTPVTLTATPAQGAAFNGWGDACSGTGSCVVTMNAAANVSAAFSGNGAPQATQTWVSATSGSDSNPCTRTAPCLTFAAALDQTAAGGEIDALDPGDFGAMTITKAITFDGGDSQVASIPAVGINGIVVSAGPNDVVTIRNLRIDGAIGTSSGSLNGILFNSGAALVVEHFDIFGFGNNGIAITPSTNARVVLADGHISNTAPTAGNAAVLIAPTANVSVTINRVYMEDNLNGVFASGGGAGIIHVQVRGCVITASGNTGIAVAGTATAVTADIINSVISYSGNTGAAVAGNAATLKLGGNTITNNVTGVASARGTLLSFKSNQISDNGTDGTPINAVPGYSGTLQ